MCSFVPRWKVELPQSEAGDDVFGGCRGVEESYERLDQIGEGTYGQVSSPATQLTAYMGASPHDSSAGASLHTGKLVVCLTDCPASRHNQADRKQNEQRRR